jgi:hypothetical protein
LSGRQAQESKNKTHKAKDQTEYTPQQVYDCAIFYLAICAFDIQIGWNDAVERQRKYMRRDLFMGKLNPEKCSQRLQYMNKYLDFIPIKKIQGQKRTKRHMASHCQMMRSDPSWDKPSDLNGQ